MLEKPSIKLFEQKTLVGHTMRMSLGENKTPELWRSFMPLRNEFTNRVSNDFFSIQVYAPDFTLEHFDEKTLFDKWACVELENMANIPSGMQTLIIPQGLYAVFNFKGSIKEAPSIFRYIFTQWLPKSGYALDNRPHFEILGEKYSNTSPDSEEEIWIPIKQN